MEQEFVLPPALERGDKVAIIGAGNGPAKNIFPEVYEQGLERLRQVFGLETVEYPSVEMTPEESSENHEQRAKDVMDAFEHDEIKAVIAPIGGTGEQIRILNHLDPEVLRDNPTRFYGYSDNTSLNLYLYNLGIVSFQGPMVMTELAMQGGMHEYTRKYCEKAFFEDSLGEITAPEKFTDEDLNWGDTSNLDQERELEPHPGFEWHNFDDEEVRGRIWGGCLEVIDINLGADRNIPNPKEAEGKILALETSEELPDEFCLNDFFLSIGERGLLEKFSAVIVGLPKARSHSHDKNPEEREEYRQMHKETVKDRMEDYAPDTPVLFDANFGHIDPIFPLPVGGKISLKPREKQIEIDFK